MTVNGYPNSNPQFPFAELTRTRQNAGMNHYSINLVLLLTIAATTLSLNTTAAQQVFPPIAPIKSNDSDPVADADFYLQKSETQIAELQTFVNSLRKKNNLKEFPYRPVMFSSRDVRQAFHTLGLAKDQIEPLPDHIGKIKHQTHKRLTQKLQRLDNYLKTVRTSLQASLDPQSYSNLRPDAVRFRGLGIMLANLDSFKTDPTLAAAIYRQLPFAEQEVDLLKAQYDLLIDQKTIPGTQLAGLDRYFQSKRNSFLAVAKQNQQALPQQIKDSLNEIAKQLKQLASQESDQGETSVDLRTQLRKTKANLELLEVLHRQTFDFMMPQRKQLFDLQVRLQKTEPSDNYTGDDRDDLLKALALSDQKPTFTKIRIPSTKWTQRTYWQYNGQRWREIDRSVLPFYVLPSDENANSDWQEYLFAKDHLKDDQISVQSVR